MGKIKGWKKIELDESDKEDEFERKYLWNTTKLYHLESIEIIKYKDNTIIVFYSNMGEGKEFKNLVDAKTFAVKYMKEHPEGEE